MKAAKFWQKTDPGLRAHPAFLDLVEELGTSPLMADGLLHGLWAMAFNDAPDGDLTRFKPRALARAIGWPHNGEKMIEALLAAGFLEHVPVTDGTEKLVIHDWFDWGGALFRQRDDIRSRVARFREKPANEDSGNGYVTRGNGYPRAEIEIENKKEKNVAAENEFFTAFWTLWPTGGSKKTARDRFMAATSPERQRILVAGERYAAAVPRLNFTVRAENFIGGRKTYYEEWADGPPPPDSPWFARNGNGSGPKEEDW